MMRRLAMLAAIALLVCGGQGARAQATDPADLAFWQSINNSTNPAEYRAYLQAFPNGKFAPIARLRIDPATPAPGPVTGRIIAPGPTPAPVPPPAPVADDGPSLTITPPNGRVGQKFIIGCVNFPEVDTRDSIVVVHTGTPVMDPRRNREETKVLYNNFAITCPQNGGSIRDVGPFAPGSYEVRYMSVLYNDANNYELKATVPFTVR